ncbi:MULTISPECIES: nucleoside triphosphate pyrophosphohydrolase [unclassified Acinetobacter]|uniref:nucleoside triphosphate pyrophosphohydrolase n=1 Tax=unclassified Acinetobacter TaxID=196816 RepID=UPI0029344E4D|nr:MULTISPECIES: nucleoside triphosphate pyrophosphohydrolase [unclassified Acinetobacter]WOE30421.1 nucleoside triphosphate pyrophosphohydrolase [Acinetobacter sp. SAAs470]WOE38612.1 nucleoside triphosphate pyrophosphohydrolase [Acinetobacter sp. SAAs474]
MQQLLQIMQQLRQQCPWDQAQTPQTLTPYAIEEAYEVEAAVRSGDIAQIKEELGDLLLQVVFQSQMYQEQDAFDFQDVVNTLIAKLIRRHPHVFNPQQHQQLSTAQVTALWQSIKAQEKKAQLPSRLDEVKHGPAIQQAHDLQKKAANVGFDFTDLQCALAKVEEEFAELKAAIQTQQTDEIQAELGDCLFSLINVGRKLNLSSEIALLGTIDKFRSRFAYIEQQALLQHKDIEQMSLVEMDLLWEQAKLFLQK